MTAGIYRIRNKITGCVYIGSSIAVEGRVRQHLYELRRGRHGNKPLQAAWQAHGFAAFVFGLLEETSTDECELADAEARWMTDPRTAPRGLYNLRLTTKRRGYEKFLPRLYREAQAEIASLRAEIKRIQSIP